MAAIFGQRHRFSPRKWQLLCGFWRVFPLVDVLDTELSACYQSHFSEAVPAMWSVLICLL